MHDKKRSLAFEEILNTSIARETKSRTDELALDREFVSESKKLGHSRQRGIKEEKFIQVIAEVSKLLY